MMRVTLPFRRALHQPLTASASAAVNALSLSMTLAAACRHWPANLPFAIATAITAELCKLALSWNGILGLQRSHTWRGRAGAIVSLSLAAVFQVGSISASVVCMSQAESTEHTRVLHDSRAYASALERLHGLDAQLSAMRTAADHDVNNGFRKRGLATLERIGALGQERQSAEAQVAALEHHPVAASSGAVLPQVLALLGAATTPDIVRFLVEVVIGAAIELAGFIFLWRSAAQAMVGGTDGLPSPPPSKARSRRPLVASAQAPTLASSRAPEPQTAVCAPARARTEVPTGNPVPASYARWLRFGTGPRLEALLAPLDASRCAGACRDLLTRMGNHCLREGGTNGTIDAEAIRRDLRAGRDWRTIQSYLATLVELGALSLDGSTYTITHFLDANPTLQRRTERLAELRSKACKRQRKHRSPLQTLQASPLQEAGLSAPSTIRHAQKPQPTTHAAAVDFQAAHAATHLPTVATPPHLCDSSQQDASTVRQRRSYGAVKASAPSTLDDQAWFAELAAIEARGAQAGDAFAATVAAEADEFERTLAPNVPTASVGLINESIQAKQHCFAVRIPSDTPPVNLHDVAQACLKIGLPEFGRQCDALFRRLSADAVRQAELAYAAWCTRHAIDEGNLRKSAVGMMLDIIRRQRLQAPAERLAC